MPEIKALVKGEPVPEKSPPSGPSPEELKAKADAAEERRLRELAEQDKAQLEQERDDARRATANAAKETELVKQELAKVQSQPAHVPVIQKVPEPTPEMVSEMDRLRTTLAQTERRLNELLQLAHGKEELKKEIQQLEETKRQTQISLADYGVRFDDTGRDPRGGSQLEDALAPLFEATPRILGETLKLRRNGIGGECKEDRIRALVPQLRDLANELDKILKERQTRHMTIIHSEVQ